MTSVSKSLRSIIKIMKTFRLFAVFAFAAIFAVSSAFAQAGGAVPVAAQAGTAKIVVIDTGAFAAEKGGITRYNTAMKSLNTVFSPVETELTTMASRLQKMQDEINVIQQQAANGKIPVDQKAAQAKVDAFQTLSTEFKRKQEDAKARLDREQDRVMAPVMQDIYKAMQEFAAQKGYDMILDAGKLDSQQIILAFLPNKLDVTKEFIIYYNSRPATTATAAAPK